MNNLSGSVESRHAGQTASETDKNVGQYHGGSTPLVRVGTDSSGSSAPPAQNGAVEIISTVPRSHCDHDWQITGYSYVAPSRDLYDRPEFVYYRCRKCGEESMEDFQ